MATQDEIAAVRSLLGPNSLAEGWTDEQIEALLDAGQNPNEIARDYWESQMASASTLADVSESGSSRKLSQLFTNATALAAYHRGAATALDPANGNTAVSRPIKRV